MENQAASIITLRIIMIIMANVISSTGEYYAYRPCAQINYTLGENRTRTLYPSCEPFYTGQNPDQYVLIPAKIGGQGTNAATTAAALDESFGAAFWLALVLHAVGIEVYVTSATSPYNFPQYCQN